MRTALLCSAFLLTIAAPALATGLARPALVVQAGHSADVGAIAWSPAGDLLVSGGDDGALKLWDANAGVLRQTVAVRPDGAGWSAVVFSATGRAFSATHASGQSTSDFTEVFDVASGDSLLRVEDENAAWSPDGKRFAWCADGRKQDSRELNVFDLATHRTSKAPAILGMGPTWSPDGKLIALTGGDQNEAVLHDGRTGRELRRLKPGGEVALLTFSPDSRLVGLQTNDQEVQIWTVAGKQLGRFTDASGFSFSPEADLVAISVASQGQAQETLVWSVEQRRPLLHLPGNISGGTWSSDGRRLALLSEDSTTVTLYDTASGDQVFATPKLDNATHSALSPDGNALLVSTSGQTVIFDLRTHARLGELAVTFDSVLWAPDTRFATLAACQSASLGGDCLNGQRALSTLVDVSTGQELKGDVNSDWSWLVAARPGAPEIALAHSRNATAEAAEQARRTDILLIDVRTGKLVRQLSGTQAAVTNAQFVAGGQRVVATDDGGRLEVWNVASGTLAGAFQLPPDRRFDSLATAPGGKWFATEDVKINGKSYQAHSDWHAALWNSEERDLKPIELGLAYAGWLSWSPDGKTLAVETYTGDFYTSELHLIDAESRRELAKVTIPGHTSPTWSPGGDRLLLWGETGYQTPWHLQVLDGHSGQRFVELEGKDATSFLGWSPELRLIVLSSGDTGIQLLSADTGKPVARAADADFSQWTAKKLTPVAVSAAFTSNGKYLVVRRGWGALEVFDTATWSVVDNGYVGKLSYDLELAPDDRHVVLWRRAVLSQEETASLTMRDFTGQEQEWDFKDSKHDFSQALFAGDGSRVLALGKDSVIRLYDVKGRKKLATIPGIATKLVRSPDGRFALAIADTLRLIRLADGASISLWNTGSAAQPRPLVFTDDGAFDGDDRAWSRLVYRVGTDIVTSEQLFDRFYHPSLAADFASGASVALSKEALKGIGLPPEVSFVHAPLREATSDTLTLCVRTVDRGGGIAEVRTFVNGVRADRNGSGRGLKRKSSEDAGCPVTGQPKGTQVQSLEVALAPGDNQVDVEAYSNLGRVRSARAHATVHYSGESGNDVKLHVLAFTLDHYADPSQTLSFANADGDALIESLKKDRLFAEVNVTRLSDAGATRAGVKDAIAKIAAELRPRDVFLLYAAGHGLMLQCPGESEPHYRLVTYDASLRSDSQLCEHAVPDTELASLARQIPAHKKIVILDTCQSGGAASAQMLVAMRGSRELEAMHRLAKAEGLAIVSASQASEYAGEVPKLGHGIFTYALIEGLSGKAAVEPNKPVTIFELLGYVQTRVPALAQEYFGNGQTPIVSLQGQDFPFAAP